MTHRASLAGWGFGCFLMFVDCGKQHFGPTPAVSSSWAAHPNDESGYSAAASWDLSSGDSSYGGRRRLSRPGSNPRADYSVRRNGRKRAEKETTTTSSDNLWDEDFLPLVFSEDEREEEILSALEKVEKNEHAEKKQRKRTKKIREDTIKSTINGEPKPLSSHKVKSHPAVKKRKMNPESDVTSAMKKEKSQPADIQPTKSVPSKTKPLPNGLPDTIAAKAHNSNNWPSHEIPSTLPGVNSASSTGSQPPITSSKTMERTIRTGTSTMFPHSGASPFVPSNSAAYSKPTGVLPTTASSLNGSRRPPGSHTGVYRTSLKPTPSVGATASAPPAKSQSRPARQQPPNPSSVSATTPWVRRYLSSRPKDALLPIPRAYLTDGFNLVQLAPIVERVAMTSEGYTRPAAAAPESHKQSSPSFPYYKAALRLILQEDENAPAPVPAVQRAAEALYVLVHARYVISPRGLDTVHRVMKRETSEVDPVFGRCPRFGCRGMPLLPYGESDDIDLNAAPTSRSKRYCCCCGEKLYMWDSKVDGCAWGPSFCHLLLMTYGDDLFPGLVRIQDAELATPPDEKPVRMVAPSIFGFKLHPSCKVRYPRRVETNR